MKQYKRKHLKYYLIFLAICVLMIAFFLIGCKLYETPEQEMKRMMEEKYGEEFIVYSAYRDGAWLKTVIAPENDPTLVFEQEKRGDELVFGSRYYAAYGSRLVVQMLEEDIYKFFPDSYIYASVYPFTVIDPMIEFRGQNIEEFMANSRIDNTLSFSITVFFSGDSGTVDQYKNEYEFFSKQVDEYVKAGLMPKLSLVLCKTSQETVEELKIHMETNAYDDFIHQKEEEATKLYSCFYDKEYWDISYITEEEYIVKRRAQDAGREIK